MTKKLQGIPIRTVLLICILMFVIGFFSYKYIYYFVHNTGQTSTFSFTNPALNYDNLRDSIMNTKSLHLSGQITTYMNQKESWWDITHLSVYFRDLNNWGWFGINEKEEFSPASLMKLPILLAYMKKSESISWFLDERLIYKTTSTAQSYTQNVVPEHQLVDGQSYSLREILEDLITYSDNNASALLESHLPMAELQKTFTDIWLTFPAITGWSFDNNLRVIDYASFFRVLFNASYLNRVDSEKALNLLTKVEFKKWLVAWVPSSIQISHKFGERWIISENWREQKQLHDCGIVYYPDHPYILCIMTRWYDWNTLSSTLADVSKIVYNRVEDQYHESMESR